MDCDISESYATCMWPEFYVNKDLFLSVLNRVMKG